MRYYRFKILFNYALAKLKFIHFLLPKKVTNELPTGWNNQMFWTAFKSGGKELYFDYYCRLKEPTSYEPKVAVDSEFLLEEKDIRFFYENGYLGPFDLISPDEAEQLKEYFINRLIQNESQIYSYSKGDYEFGSQQGDDRDQQPSNSRQKLMTETQKYYADRLNTINRHLEEPRLVNLFKSPAITERCAQLLGSDLILWQTQFFEKPPFGSKTKWHQASVWLYDNFKEPVLQTSRIEELFQLTCWIALTDATPENGCMALIPGSHREIYPVKITTDLQNPSNQSDRTYGVYAGDINYTIHPNDIKLIEMKAGQFFFFSERVIHGSSDNVTDGWRWAVSGRLARTDTRVYSQKMLEDCHEIVAYGIKKLKLDNWKAVLLHGEDRFGYNRLL